VFPIAMNPSAPMNQDRLVIRVEFAGESFGEIDDPEICAVPSTERRCEHAAVNGGGSARLTSFQSGCDPRPALVRRMAPRLCETSVPAIESNFSSDRASRCIC